MNILIRNCWGALNPTFINVVNDLVLSHSSAIMIVTESKVGRTRAKGIAKRLPFDGVICSNTIGLFGGLWHLWDPNHIEVFELASMEQEIHMLISNSSLPQSWLLSAIYASLRYVERQLL